MTTNTKSDCIFCKIVAGEIAGEKIYEDSEVLALLNIRPIHPGHSLIIPKDHFENIYTIPPETWARMNLTAQKVALAVREAVDADGINVHMNNEVAAGQEIFHGHIHIIPRHNDDGLAHWTGKEISSDETSRIAEKVRAII